MNTETFETFVFEVTKASDFNLPMMPATYYRCDESQNFWTLACTYKDPYDSLFDLAYLNRGLGHEAMAIFYGFASPVVNDEPSDEEKRRCRILVNLNLKGDVEIGCQFEGDEIFVPLPDEAEGMFVDAIHEAIVRYESESKEEN